MSHEPFEEYKYKEKLDLPDLQPKVHKINCPSCSTDISADNINIHTNVAKCNNCNVVFSIDMEIRGLSNQHKVTQEILQPEGVEINYFKEEIDISVQQPWGTLEAITLSLAPLLMLAVIGITVENILPTEFAKIGLISLIVAFVSGYISYFFIRKRHKIYIHVDKQHLYIERRPRKLIKDKRYNVRDIDQIYTKSVQTSSGHPGSAVFMIVNGINGQKHVELIKSVSSRSKAKYIEQEIEKHLGIKDRTVPDEAT